MDPQPPPPPQPPPASPLSSTAAITTTTTNTTINMPTAAVAASAGYPDSIDSSPRSRTTDPYFDDPPLLSSKLRLMCSYGGHVFPRPHDKSLCYVGGDTRIVVVDRNTTLASLSNRLSNSLLNGRPFTLKYQLPNEDLDSLISVTTDEDLENMIDEYDRTSSNAANSSSKSSRLRLFLFPLKPDSSQSIGSILENSAKSEDWFLNALNGATSGLLNRGFSDSASVNCLLGLDDDAIVNVNNNLDLVAGGGVGGGRDSEGSNKNVKQGQGQDVHSVPDSPMLETTSSFGSTSSSPSLANLPPIRVHMEDGSGGGSGGGVRGIVQDQKVVGIEEQFAQISVGQKQDEGFAVLSSPPPMPVSIVSVSGVPVGAPVVGEYQNRVFSDDERSDHGAPVGYRKPPPPQPQNLPPQTQQKSGGGGIDFPSPDSVSSDSSLSNAINRQKPVIYQDPIVQIPSGVSRVAANPVDPKINISDPNTRLQVPQQVQDSGYVLQPQFDQQQQQQQQPQQQPQQFIHAGAHYIHHHPTGAVPISAYYPVYPPQQQQHHQHHHQLDQQYPVYYVPARQPQAYNLPVQQPSISEPATTISSTRPQTPPNPTLVPSSAAYNPMRNAPIAKPEMTAPGMYRTATTGTPQLVQVPSSQHQQQYVGYSQVHHPSQSVAPTSAGYSQGHHPSQSANPTSAGTANYAYEFSDPAHAQIYYAQHLTHAMPPQYQTMAGTAAVVLPEASVQHPSDNIKQQIRTSQPI